MVLVGIQQEFGGDTAHDGGTESRLSLRAEDTVVFLAVDAKDGCVPTVYVEVGTGGEGIHLLLVVHLFRVVWVALMPLRQGLHRGPSWETTSLPFHNIAVAC